MNYRIRNKSLPIGLLLLLAGNMDSGMCLSSQAATPSLEKYLVNPVADRGADPWVVRHDGFYLYCYSRSGSIVINRGKTLTEVLQRSAGTDWQKQLIDSKLGRAVWTAEPGKPYSKEIWAPELHRIGDRWYIYFAADDGHNENHRMYVLKSRADDSMGEYELVGKISAATDKWAIDGTVMQHEGKLYFIWSGWEGDVNVAQNLYIARMKSPTEIEGERSLISKPIYSWEKIGEPLVNEGPEVLQHGGKTFIIYSASGSWTDSYCLGQLSLIGKDPMNPKSWRKTKKPVFAGTKDVVSPGHASFVQSPDGKESWIIYHAAKERGSGWNRNLRAQPYTWDSKGNPIFSRPIAAGVRVKAPAGE